MQPQENQNAIQTAIKLGKSLGDVKTINGVPAIIKPEGYEIELYPGLEKPLVRIREDVSLETVKSFIEFVNHYDSGTSVLFIKDDSHIFKVVFDYHTQEVPGRCEFQAVYLCPTSDEWNTWNENSKVKMNQWDFAQFLENNIDDIVEPSGSEMLSCSLALESTKKADFSSSIRLNNGEVQLKYEEDIQGASKNNSVNIPEEFFIGIPVFKNGESYKVKARLRYRINDSQLSLWYELVKPKKVSEDAFDGVKEQVTREIALPAYI